MRRTWWHGRHRLRHFAAESASRAGASWRSASGWKAARRSMPRAAWCCRAASTAIATSSSCRPTAAPTRRRSKRAAARPLRAAPPPSSPSPPQFKGEPIAPHRWTSTERRAARRRCRLRASTRSSPTRPTEVLDARCPASSRAGMRSFKVFLTYDPLHIDDRQYLRVLAAAQRNGATVTRPLRELRGHPWRIEALLARRAHGAGIPRRVAARRWWSARRPTGRSRWPSWSTSRSRSSTSPAPKWPRRSTGPGARRQGDG